MRIGIVYLGRRGLGGPISLNIATHLSEQVEVFAVVSSYSEILENWKNSGVKLIVQPTYRFALEAAWGWVDHRRIRKAAALIKARNPDVLLFPMFYTWNPLIQMYLKDIPAIVAVHDPIPHPGLTAWVYRILEDASIRQAKRCLLFSRVFIPDLQRRGVRPDQIDVIPLGEISFSPINAENKVSTVQSESSPPVLLFFGRITEYKGLDILLKACHQLSPVFDFKLRIVGTGNIRPYRDLLESFANVEVENRWIGEDEIASFFAQADVVILPYTSASQSGVIPLAASFGLPVIATRVGGIPEQIVDEHTGLLIEPNSVDQLVGAIRRLLVDPTFSRNLGLNLMREFKEQRNWRKISAKVLEICQKAAL